MPQPTASQPAVVSRPPSAAPRAPAPRAPAPRSPSPARRNGYGGPRRPSPRPTGGHRTGFKAGGKPGDKPEHEILFQQYFKSANPQRTYAAQLKKASNGNHYLVLTEGKRDDATGEVRKTRLFIYSEDFKEYFSLLQATAQFIRANPVPDAVKAKRDKFWAKKSAETPAPAAPAPRAP